MINKRRKNYFVVLLRLIVPFTIFINPFWGSIASLLADNTDVVLIDLLKLKKFKNYTLIDKLLDTYYLSFEFIIALSWNNDFAKTIAVFLFFYRLIGVVIFLINSKRVALVFFPNIFEYFYLFFAFFLYQRGYELSINWQLFLLTCLMPFKLIQEYILHYKQYHPWEAIKHRIKT